MKEAGQHKSKSEEDFERHKEYMIDKGYDYKCNTCKKVWYPTTEDISLKRPSCYYRGCGVCRLKSFTKGKEYKQKKGNNFNALYANSQTISAEGQYT